MTAGNRHHPGTGPEGDPLTAAVAGEPLTDAQLADDGFMAGYREADADVAALREQLGLIADALTAVPSAAEPESAVRRSRAEEPTPAVRPRPEPPSPRPLRPRRRRSLVLGALAVAAVAALLSGMGWLLTRTGGEDSAASADAKAAGGGAGYDSAPAYLACARLVVEGDITAVRPQEGASGRYRVTVHVTRAYKPASVRDRVTVVTDASAEPRPRTGLHVLIGVTGASVTAVPDLWVTGKAQIAEQRAAFRAESAVTPAPGCS